MSEEACACLVVEFRPWEYPDGSKGERWQCRDCGRRFVPRPSPLDAPSRFPELTARGIAADVKLLQEQVAGIYRRPPDPTPEFLERLWACGVTRYRAGDLEIELAPAAATALPPWKPPCGFEMCADASRYGCAECPKASPGVDDAAEQLGRAVRGPGYLERVPASSPAPDDAPSKPDPEPPDEKPAVEIDFAATEKLLREHDERRRGQGT